MSHYGGLFTGLQTTKNESITDPKSEPFMTGNRLPDTLDFLEKSLLAPAVFREADYVYTTDTDAFLELIKTHYKYIFRSRGMNVNVATEEDSRTLKTLATINQGTEDTYLKNYVSAFLEFVHNFTHTDDINLFSFNSSTLTKARGRFLKSDDTWWWDYYSFIIQAICFTFDPLFKANFTSSENIPFMIPSTQGILEPLPGVGLFVKSFKSESALDYLAEYAKSGSKITPYEKFIMTLVFSNFNEKEETDYINALLVLFNILAYSARPVYYSNYRYSSNGGMEISIRNIVASLFKKSLMYSNSYIDMISAKSFEYEVTKKVFGDLCLGLPYVIYDSAAVSGFIMFLKDLFRKNFNDRSFNYEAYIPDKYNAFRYRITCCFCDGILRYGLHGGSSGIKKIIASYSDLSPKAAIEAVVGAVSEQDMDFDPETKLNEGDTSEDAPEGATGEADTSSEGDTGDTGEDLGEGGGDDNNNIAQPTGGTDLTPGTPPPDGETLAIPLRTQDDQPAAATLYRHAVVRMCARLSSKPGLIEQSKLDKLNAWVDFWLFFSPVKATVTFVKELGLANNLSTLVPDNVGTNRE